MTDQYLHLVIPKYCPAHTTDGTSDLRYKIIKSADSNLSIIKKSRSSECLPLTNGQTKETTCDPPPVHNEIYEILPNSSGNTGTKVILHRKSAHFTMGHSSLEVQQTDDKKSSKRTKRTKSLSPRTLSEDERNKRHRPSSTPINGILNLEFQTIRKRLHNGSKSTAAKNIKISDQSVKRQDSKLDDATNGSANVQSFATPLEHSPIMEPPLQQFSIEVAVPNVTSDLNIPSTTENRMTDEQESLLIPMDRIKTESFDDNRTAVNACSEPIVDTSHTTTIKSEVLRGNSWDISIKSELEDIQSTTGLSSEELIVQNSATRTEISMSNMGKPTTNGGNGKSSLIHCYFITYSY